MISAKLINPVLPVTQTRPEEGKSQAATQENSSPLTRDQMPASSKPNWIEEVMTAANKDTRYQPWKAMFNEGTVDCCIDDGKDLVIIKENIGGHNVGPFRTQGSSLAA